MLLALCSKHPPSRYKLSTNSEACSDLQPWWGLMQSRCLLGKHFSVITKFLTNRSFAFPKTLHAIFRVHVSKEGSHTMVSFLFPHLWFNFIKSVQHCDSAGIEFLILFEIHPHLQLLHPMMVWNLLVYLIHFFVDFIQPRYVVQERFLSLVDHCSPHSMSCSSPFFFYFYLYKSY